MHMKMLVITEEPVSSEEINFLIEHWHNHEWDWFEVGGRWNNALKTKFYGKGVNSCLKKQFDFDAKDNVCFHTIFTLSGDWFDKYQTSDKGNWENIVKEFLLKQPDDAVFTLVDYHN